ncbi:hypothetical protein HYH02_015179 [Chlamydomonas schloesseri]|uniref:Uncharacterized protein n=1 Tax=Chlamydomonas schloesseri TaxID=2026947 RepID=A0A835VSL8_9CHLO|nr:hypothetical protein HYH02_015179 [Chlamydomonas schloesseri]|eukprot:KAG2424318.1 hypothetical protein HYH02_015179 [Chlamydomonas schloesseri]
MWRCSVQTRVPAVQRDPQLHVMRLLVCVLACTLPEEVAALHLAEQGVDDAASVLASMSKRSVMAFLRRVLRAGTPEPAWGLGLGDTDAADLSCLHRYLGSLFTWASSGARVFSALQASNMVRIVEAGDACTVCVEDRFTQSCELYLESNAAAAAADKDEGEVVELVAPTKRARPDTVYTTIYAAPQLVQLVQLVPIVQLVPQLVQLVPIVQLVPQLVQLVPLAHFAPAPIVQFVQPQLQPQPAPQVPANPAHTHGDPPVSPQAPDRGRQVKRVRFAL